MPLSRTLSLLFIAGVLALLTTAVGAGLLTSSTSVPENTFTTGTLILGVNPTSTLVTFANMAPGDQVTQPLTVTNAGTIQLRYVMTSSTTDADSKNLVAALTLHLKAGVSDCTLSGFAASGVEVYTGALANAAFGDPTPGPQGGDRLLQANSSEALCFQVTLSPTTPNGFQLAATTATFTFSAEQSLNNPEPRDLVLGTPIIQSLDPASTPAGSADLTLTLNGSGFVNGATVEWNAVALATTYVSSAQVMITVPAGRLTSAGVAYLSVRNPAGASDPFPFYITENGARVTSAASQTVSDGFATVSTANVIISALGSGTVSVAAFDANPGGSFSTFTSDYGFVDVHLQPGNAFSAVTITDCQLNGGTAVAWWNGTQWLLASSQTYSAMTGCVTIQVDGTTAPSLAQLAGTYMGAVSPFTPTPTFTASPTWTPTPSATPTLTPSPTRTATPTVTPTPTNYIQDGGFESKSWTAWSTDGCAFDGNYYHSGSGSAVCSATTHNSVWQSFGWPGGTVVVTWWATERTNCSTKVTVAVDGVTTQTWTNSAWNAYTWTAGNFAAGAHTLKFTSAYGTCGNLMSWIDDVVVKSP